MLELLTPDRMAEADRLAIERGPHDGYGLMLNAGRAVQAQILRRFAGAARVDVLCGPGNNGGDGYVVARLLHEDGVDVRVWALAAPREGSDCARAAADCPVPSRPLADFAPAPGSLVVDALFGAGLAKPLSGAATQAARAVAQASLPVVAVDLPSGLSGDSGRAAGSSFAAALTVTFFRKKPGHLLEPGRSLCGELVVADIGIPESVLAEIAPDCFENAPALWRGLLPRAGVSTHKYTRGHVGVFSGGPAATGAARLAALAAARAGAGAVTVLSPAAAMLVNAAHLTSIMLKRVDGEDDLDAFLTGRRPDAFVLGPGFGVGDTACSFAFYILSVADGGVLVLDADAITSFHHAGEALFRAAGHSVAETVLTPHEGEFARLFPDLAADDALSKLDRAREAAWRANATIILKGSDSVIAAPDGRSAINANGTPLLATAGSGDVLAGICAGLSAQGMPVFEAACAAVWMHAQAARHFGPGLIADDLPGLVAPVLRDLLEHRAVGTRDDL